MPTANKPYCAHYASSYLPLTQNWIHRVLINHKAFIPLFLTRKKKNVDLFPIPELVSLDNFSWIGQITELLYFRLMGYIPSFYKECKKHEVKLLHVHFGYHGAKMVGLKKKLDVPLVCSFYGDDAFALMHKGKYKNLFKYADLILVLGPYMKSILVEQGCPQEKIVIHHLGIDVNKVNYKTRDFSGDRPMRFLIASSFLPKKGIDLALKALTALRAQFNFTLDIIGDGPMREELTRLIADGNLSSRVTLHGYKPYAYFIDLAYQCDVFIQASKTTDDNRKEGTPMAIADVMATGMPVISTHHSDIPEMVVDGVTGFLAQENDVVSLTECLRKLLNEPSVLHSFSESSRRHVEQYFNAANQTTTLEKFYKRLTES